MPLEIDSGYLPDWLKAILSQQSGASGGGLFSGGDAPAPQNIGLLAGGPPAFTSVNPSAPAFQGGNAPAITNSYPSMSMPQDPGPMNVGPSGAAPLFGGVRPDAPFMANGPTTVQDQYADVPLPPRRPNDPTSFQAMAPGPGTPQDINTPPAGQPNSNVVGTAASGAPEITAQKSQGLGDYLGKAANLVGSIYGAGGPGDALIALGLSNRTNGASIQALNSMNANRVSQTNLALKQYDLATKQRRESSTYKYLIGKGADPAVAAAAVDNPELMKQLVQQNEGVDQWVKGGTDRYGNPIVFRKDDPTKTMVLGGGSAGGAAPGSSTDLTGEDYLATLPERDRNVVQMIHEGRAPYPNAMSNRSPEATRIRDMVTKAYPDTDATQYKAREALRKDFEAGTAPNSAGNVITTGNTVLGHLGRFSDAAEALNNGNIPAFNAVRQTFGKAFGGAENVTDFNGMKNRVVEELTRFYRGAGGAEKDIQRELQALSESQSPTQLRRSIATQADAIESKISALQHKWKTGMPDQPDYPIFNEEGKAALDKINNRRFLTGGPDTGGSAPATAAPVAAAPGAPAAPKVKVWDRQAGKFVYE